MKRNTGRLLDLIIKHQLVLLAAAVPVLVLPRSYLWKWQQGLTTYAPLGDEAAAGLSPLTWAALGLVALPWLLRLVRQRRFSQRTPLDWPIALTLLSAAIGIWPSVDRLFSVERFLGLVAGVALCYGLVNSINTERRLQGMVALFLAGGVALALLGFALTDWTAVNSPLAAVLAPVYAMLAGLPKLGAKRLNDSLVASTLIIFVPLALCLLLAPVRRRIKPFLALVALLAAGYTVLAWSRGELLALGLTLLLLPALVRRRWRILLLAIAGAAVVALVILLAVQPANLSVSSLLAQLRPSRWQVWTRALLMMRDYPLTGIGLDTFRIIAQNEYPYFNYAFNQSEHAHNVFLQAGVDQGILGLIALLWLVVAFFRMVARISSPRLETLGQSDDQSSVISYQLLVIGLSAGFTAFLISGLFDLLGGPRAGLVLWALLGLAAAACKLCPAPAVSPSKAITAHASRFTFHVSRLTSHASLLAAVIVLVLVVAFLTYPIVASAYYDNLGCVERGRGWLWREASEEQRRACAQSALAHFQQALALWPGNAAAQRHLGTLCYHAQHPEEAVVRLLGMPGAEYHPGFLAFYDEVAKAVGAEAALPHLEQAVALAPYDFLAHLFLAEAYRADGRVAEAVDQYAAAGIELDRVLWDAGRRCRGDASTEEAMVHYEIAARLFPASPLPGYGRGDCLRGRGSYDEAVAAYQQAIALDNDNSLRKHQTLRWICSYQQEWDRAIAAYERAVRLDPNNASYQVRLGDLYRDAGRPGDARAAYQAALTLRPDDEYIKQQLAQLP